MKKSVLVFEKNNDGVHPISQWISYVRAKDVKSQFGVRLFYKNNPENWFTILETDNENNLENIIDSYLKKTGKFANFVLTENPESINIQARKLPFTLKVETRDSTNALISNVKWVGIPWLTTFDIAYLYSDSIPLSQKTKTYRGKLNVQPTKEGYRFIPDLFTLNTNTYKFFKSFESKTLALNQGLQF